MNTPKNQFHSRKKDEPIGSSWLQAFLKERGHVDSYPSVEVVWQRGHDPELEIWSCDGRKPSELAKSESANLRISLSPYETGELHYLLQLGGVLWAVISPDFPVFLGGGLKFKHSDLRWVGRAGKSNILEKQTTTKVLFLWQLMVIFPKHHWFWSAQRNDVDHDMGWNAMVWV